MAKMGSAGEDAAGRGRPAIRTVYFIRSEALGRVKIGCADDPYRRLATLQVGSPDKLSLCGVIRVDDAPAFERRLHAKFSHLRLHGEWFEPDDEMREYMDECLLDPEIPIAIILNPKEEPEPSFTFTTRAGESERAMWRRFKEEMTAAALN